MEPSQRQPEIEGFAPGECVSENSEQTCKIPVKEYLIQNTHSKQVYLQQNDFLKEYFTHTFQRRNRNRQLEFQEV